jgi:hypothetical protein
MAVLVKDVGMTTPDSDQRKKPPEMSPYLFTVLLAGFGIWCVYDGWFTTDVEMQKHIWFNRTLGPILLGWSIWDYFRMRKKIRMLGKARR